MMLWALACFACSSQRFWLSSGSSERIALSKAARAPVLLDRPYDDEDSDEPDELEELELELPLPDVVFQLPYVPRQ
jgi:hypothetical protein